MIQVKNLHKKFGKTKALDGIDLTVNKGSIYGLVGTNGAGKTTFIKLLCRNGECHFCFVSGNLLVGMAHEYLSS